MASLVPIPASGIQANYHGLGRYLELKAEGEIPGYFLTPFFEREIWEGGLRFSIKAFSGGFGELPPSQHVKISYKLPILLPIDHFNNRSVQIETAYGTFKIDIQYLEWPEPPEDNELVIQSADGSTAPVKEQTKKDEITTVLPPIHQYLPDDVTLAITALIPREGKVAVNISFNSDFLKLVESSVGDGFITWVLKWAKPPVGADNPQLVNVTTTTKWDVTIPPVPRTTRVIQPYIVDRVFLSK